MDYRIINGRLLLYDRGEFKVESRDLYIRDQKIAGIGSFDGWAENGFETIDASDRLIMPGLVNMHTHAYMTAMRNYADDVDFEEWLFKRVMPVEDQLPGEAAYWSSLFACMEMIQTGTTCFVDMHMFKGESPRAAEQAGLRAFIGRGLVGEDLYTDGLSRFQEALEEKEAYESDRIKFVLSPHAIYSCSAKLFAQVAKEADKRGMRKQTHLSESRAEVDNAVKKYGKTPVEVLLDTGFLDERTLAAHCVDMRGTDMEILKKKRVNVVTNPASNAKLGNGFAPAAVMGDQGINLCVGTDGAASNNTLNMFREMGILSLIQKGISRDSTSAPAKFVVEAATLNAAKALGMAGRLGVIEKNACADLIFLDLKAASLFPDNNILSSLCYSANGSEVDSVMVGGRFLMRDRELLTIDSERVYYEVQKIRDQYLV